MITHPTSESAMEDSPRSAATIIVPRRDDLNWRHPMFSDVFKPTQSSSILKVPAVYPPGMHTKKIQRPEPIRPAPPSKWVGRHGLLQSSESEKVVTNWNSSDSCECTGKGQAKDKRSPRLREDVVDPVPEEDSSKRDDSTNIARDVSWSLSQTFTNERVSHKNYRHHHQSQREPLLVVKQQGRGAEMTTIPQEHTRLIHIPQPQRSDPTRRPRSRSIAIKRSGHKHPEQDSQTGEIQGESAYDWATWQMYNRIVTYRQKHPVSTDYESYSQAKSKPNKAQSLLPENPLPLSSSQVAPRSFVRFEEDELLEGEIFELEM